MFVDSNDADGDELCRFWSDLAAGHYCSGEYKRIGKDGREIWLQATYNPILDMSGRPFKIVEYAIDVTATKLRQADHQSQIDAINKAHGVVTLGMDGTILDVNDNFLAILGYSAFELQGQPHAILVEKTFANSCEYAAFWQTLRSGQHHAGMFKRIGKDGRQV